MITDVVIEEDENIDCTVVDTETGQNLLEGEGAISVESNEAKKLGLALRSEQSLEEIYSLKINYIGIEGENKLEEIQINLEND